MPPISVIIATSSRPAALEQTLRSLSAVRIPDGWSAELVLVENVVRSGSEQLIRDFRSDGFTAARYFFEPARGKSRALNLALAEAKGEILLFTDDDVRYPTDWLERMCRVIAAGGADAVAGGVRLAPHLLRPWMTRTHRAWLASTADYVSPDEPSEMCGANMALSRRVFDQVGGFDTELGPGVTGGGEESLLSWQIKKAGLKLAGALHVEVEHHPDADRLRYENWVNAARGKGRARAYQWHHWFARTVPYPHLARWYWRGKLALRKIFSPPRASDHEGIAPWELSYHEEIAFFSNYLRERRRPRNYAVTGCRKLNLDQLAAAA